MKRDAWHVVAGVLAGAIVLGGAGVLSGAERHVMPPCVAPINWRRRAP